MESANEVDTDCGDVGLGVCVVGKSQEQAGLSDTGVTDEEQLEEVVVSGNMSIRYPNRLERRLYRGAVNGETEEVETLEAGQHDETFVEGGG